MEFFIKRDQKGLRNQTLLGKMTQQFDWLRPNRNVHLNLGENHVHLQDMNHIPGRDHLNSQKGDGLSKFWQSGRIREFKDNEFICSVSQTHENTHNEKLCVNASFRAHLDRD